MNYKYSVIVVLVLVILILASVNYIRETEKLEKFQENVENELSKVNIEKSKNIIYQRNMDNDILYLNVRAQQDIDGGNGTFYLFNKPNSSINVSNINSRNFTFSFFFRTMIAPEQASIRQVLVSSNYWYVDLINNTLRLVFNGIPVVSVVSIAPNIDYNCVIVIANNGINIIVNGNEKLKKMDMPDLITRTLKMGLDKNNKNNFFGMMGGIFISKEPLTGDEICEVTNFCQFESTECSFVPYGPNPMECIKSCSNNCKSAECQQICLGCNDPDSCDWVERTAENTRLGSDADVPSAPQIRAMAYDQGKILLDWKQPETTGGKIKSYVIVAYESFNRSNGIRTSVLSHPNCSVCEYLVTGLRNQVYYDIGVRAVNEIGISDMSNIETIAPQGPISPREISDSLVETDNEIMKDFLKDLDVSQNSCNVIGSKNKEGHVLDSGIPDFVDEIKDFYSDKLKNVNK